MSPTIKCPHEMEDRSPKYYDLELKTAFQNGNIIHYCEKCKTVISVENQRALNIIYALSNKFDLKL